MSLVHRVTSSKDSRTPSSSILARYARSAYALLLLGLDTYRTRRTTAADREPDLFYRRFLMFPHLTPYSSSQSPRTHHRPSPGNAPTTPTRRAGDQPPRLPPAPP